MAITNRGWHLRSMHPDDIPNAEIIRQLVGWNQTEADWDRLLALAPGGCFVAESTGVAVGTVTTTSYGSHLGWIGMLLVHPEQRRQGMGGALLQQAVQHLQGTGVACIGLDATPAGRPLYASAGFGPVWELARWQGDSPPNLQVSMAGVEARSGIPERLWPALIELDRRAFGVDRPELLRALAAQSDRTAVAADATGRILGFGMMRRGARAQMLGPLVAGNAESAVNILATLCAGLPQKPFLWDIPEPNQAVTQLAESLGFVKQRTLTRMAYGATYPAHDSTLLWAIADLATG